MPLPGLLSSRTRLLVFGAALVISGPVLADEATVPSMPGAATVTQAPAAAPEATPDEELATIEPPIACFLEPAKLESSVVDEFLAKPDDFMARYPDGGLPMVSDVRALAGSDSRTVEPLLSMAVTANTQQRAAIGSGLARAAVSCASASPDYAEWIQDMVAEADIADLMTAYVAAAGDIETAVLRFIPGGRPGSVPSISDSGQAEGGTNGLFGDEATPTKDGNFGVGGGGGYTPRGDTDNASPS
jgi:hypothetical protein